MNIFCVEAKMLCKSIDYVQKEGEESRGLERLNGSKNHQIRCFMNLATGKMQPSGS